MNIFYFSSLALEPHLFQFFREDLKHDKLEQSFHQYDDFITVLDLWKYWYHSEGIS